MSISNLEQDNIASVFFENTPSFMVVINHEGTILNCNPSFTNWVGGDISNVHFPSLIVYNFLTEQDTKSSYLHIFDNDPAERLVNWKVIKMDSNLIHILGDDITDLVLKDLKHKLIINTDYLTGLTNRRGFDGALMKAIEDRNEHSLIVFDLDGFKQVNDTMGHSAGDEILKEVAERLKVCSRDDDIAARLGGDEFALLVKYNHDNPVIAERLLSALTEPYTCNGETVDFISASIGKLDFNSFEVELKQPSILLDIADKLMYESKKQGKGRWTQRSLVP